MLGYALTRIAVALGLIWAVVTLVFLIIHFVPGDPAELLLSQAASRRTLPRSSSCARAGLDRPILDQYLGYVGGLLKGDLGSSLLDDHSVRRRDRARLPRTLELILAASLIAVLSVCRSARSPRARPAARSIACWRVRPASGFPSRCLWSARSLS